MIGRLDWTGQAMKAECHQNERLQEMKTLRHGGRLEVTQLQEVTLVSGYG